MKLAWLSPCLQSLPPCPVSVWYPCSWCPVADSQSGWVCGCPRTLWAPYMDSPERLRFSSATPTPTGLQLEVMRLYSSTTRTLGCAIWPGAGIASSSVVPPGFYPPHVNVGPPVSWAAAYICFTVPHHISVPLTHQDECFLFKSLVV